MKILVTGGAGFIGSHVADAYRSAGHEVVVVDNLLTGSMKNLPEGARFYLMDIQAAELEKLFASERPEVVNHQAAQISVTVSSRNPQLDARINALGMLNVLENAARSGVRKIIFASSGGAIYGEADTLPTPESHPPRPLSPYGIHKLLGEHYLRYYRHQHGLEYTALRYANVYGPRQSPEGEAGVVAIFIRQLLDGKAPTIHAYPDEPDGMSRDYVYVADVAQANLLALERGAGEILNIGTGTATSTGALYRQIAGLLGRDTEPRRGGPRPGDLRRSCLDPARARQLLGWTPRTALSAGLAATVESLQSL
jgi:UDP-glucose 4-epimerase